MADFDKDPNSVGTNENNDVLSELEALSKKYGIAFDSSRYKSPSQNSHYAPHTPDADPSRVYNPPKNNNPARTPRIVYDADSPRGGVKVVYEDTGSVPQGPQGRRVVYQEQESESIAEKRRRNAAATPQKTAKGSQGFGSQPYVRHVASSESAVKRDDGEAFSKAYEEKKTEPAVTQTEPQTELKGSSRAVAKGEKKPVHQHYEETAGEKVARFFKAFIPWKGDPAKEVARKLVMDISAILVLICFGYFINNYIEHQNQLKHNESLKVTEAQTSELDVQWAAIKAKYPDIDFPEGMNIKFAELYATNQDMVGYLHIDNTNIDTPVVQNKADRDSGSENFYLRHNFYKKDDKYGVAYLDAYNTGSELDQNNIIYGHNMTDGLAFAQLEKYYTIDGFKESPVIKYSTLFNDYYFKVYAVIITNGYPSGDNGYLFNYIAAHFPTDENFEGFIEALDERKLYDTGVDINKDDKLITLSTCSYEIKQTDMGRLAVIGRLVRDGESTAVDTSKATENTNIRYPQIWYDEHNTSNPFKDAYQWESQ